MQVIVFDNETTGKPKRNNAPMSDVENWPRVTQVAWSVWDYEEARLIKSIATYVKPDGWTVPSVAALIAKGWDPAAAKAEAGFFEEHGMSTEKCEAEGRPMREVLADFIADLDECDIMVAHNLNFDHNTLGAEMIRYQMKPKPNPIRLKICTMLTSIEYCRIPFGKGGFYSRKESFKWPKLEELYKKLFDREMGDGAHDAGFDTTACGEAFFELVKRGIIKVNFK